MLDYYAFHAVFKLHIKPLSYLFFLILICKSKDEGSLSDNRLALINFH